MEPSTLDVWFQEAEKAIVTWAEQFPHGPVNKASIVLHRPGATPEDGNRYHGNRRFRKGYSEGRYFTVAYRVPADYPNVGGTMRLAMFGEWQRPGNWVLFAD